MGFIPEETIAQVLDRSDIVAVISSYISLKPAGRNFKACCPFHHEKTPSFMVNPDKQIFHCFGCQVGGNVISFVMQQERLGFPEALRLLAVKAGVEIPEHAPQDTQASQLRQQIKKINAQAAEYFHNQLLTGKSETALAAREYLQSRGITLSAAKRFQLGLATDSWNGLLEFLRAKDVAVAVLEKAGLVLPQTKGNGFYDRFRRRIMFPIFDVKGECVAFGGRALPGVDENAKYLNSPETPVYTKGQHLYGFHWAKETVSREDSVVVVEGYMDFVTPFGAGVGNVVASLGTALTVDQIRLLRRYTHNVVMLYDADPAGQNAMLRSLDTLIEEGMNVQVAALAEGEDPDSFVRRAGVEDFRAQIKAADSLFDFKLKFLVQRFGDRSVEARAKISSEMLPTINRFTNGIIRSEYLKRLAQVLLLSVDALAQESRRLAQVPDHSTRREEPRVVAAVPPKAARAVEENLVRLMLAHPESVVKIRRQADLSDFQDEGLRQIVTRLFEIVDQGQEIKLSELMASFEDPEILKLISSLVAAEEELSGDRTRMVQDCLSRLEQDRQRSRRLVLRQEMESAQLRGDGRVEELLQEFNQLIKGKG